MDVSACPQAEKFRGVATLYRVSAWGQGHRPTPKHQFQFNGGNSYEKRVKQNASGVEFGGIFWDKRAGSGIKTKHIQNRAITSKKIKNKAVTTAKIRDGAVTAAKIAGGPGSGVDADTVDGQHAADLQGYADGAVTTHTAIPGAHHTKTSSFTDLSDTATDAQIPDNITINQAANADMVDGVHAADLQGYADGAVTTHTAIPGAHHTKTSSFTDLSDTATDAQIPNNITINQAVNADTVDGVHAAALEESAEIDADIATHTGNASAHHAKYTDAEARTAVDDGTYEKLYNNVIVVSPDGNGDFTDPRLAVNSITDASATNPYLVKIMPGVYDIGTSSVQMKEYVDIGGCGENVTKITGTINSSASGVVRGASNAELRLLSVENTGGGSWAMAIYNNSASPKLTQVTATASGGTSSLGVYSYLSSPTMTQVTATAFGGAISNNGVLNHNSSSPTMTNVTATASGGWHSVGVVNNSSSPTMTNLTATASGGTIKNYGVYNLTSGTTKIDHSVISGTTNTIYIHDPGITIYVGNTRLDGGAVNNAGAGTITCIGAYDENYTALNANCQ